MKAKRGTQLFWQGSKKKQKDVMISFLFFWLRLLVLFSIRNCRRRCSGSDNGLCLWHFLLDLGDLLLASSQSATGHKQTNSDAETTSKQNTNPNKLIQIKSNSKIYLCKTWKIALIFTDLPINDLIVKYLDLKTNIVSKFKFREQVWRDPACLSLSFILPILVSSMMEPQSKQGSLLFREKRIEQE